MLRVAKRSILIEQQYIRSSQPDIAVLLGAIREAIDENPELDVRIVLGKIFGAADVIKCVFRTNVTARFGIVTAEFGNVTGQFGDVTDGVFVTA